MERLTHEADFGFEDWEETLFFVKSDPNGAYNILDIAKYQGESEFDEILKNVALRLAAYENTGLEPEEIERILDEHGRGLTLRDSVGERLETVREIPIDRLRELAQADRDGRCVVLPCKFGDSVYFALLGRVIEKSVFSVVAFSNSQRIYCNGTSEYFRPEDVGKTVFLTREEAEAKLKEREKE